MTSNISKLRVKLKAVRRFNQRGGKGFFSHRNNELTDVWALEIARLRAKTERRQRRLEQEAIANILRGQRELERRAA